MTHPANSWRRVRPFGQSRTRPCRLRSGPGESLRTRAEPACPAYSTSFRNRERQTKKMLATCCLLTCTRSSDMPCPGFIYLFIYFLVLLSLLLLLVLYICEYVYVHGERSYCICTARNMLQSVRQNELKPAASQASQV
jgi:hypothetical protein